MTQLKDLLEGIIEKCANSKYLWTIELGNLLEEFPQYPIIEEYIRWEEGQFFKHGYDNTDMKLYWFSKGRAADLEIVKTLFYVEGLILLHNNVFSIEHFTIACLKIFIHKTTQFGSIEEVTSLIELTYNFIMRNKEEILEGSKTWRPEPRHHSSKSKIIYKNIDKGLFVKILDKCKEMNGHKSYSFCKQYFTQNTGLSTTTFKNYVKKYNIEFDEKEERGGKKPNSGRKKMTSHYTWLDEIQDDEWKLSVEEIWNIVKKRNNMLAEGLSVSKIKNWKYKKMKELGLKKNDESLKKKIIPDINMEFSDHQIEVQNNTSSVEELK